MEKTRSDTVFFITCIERLPDYNNCFIEGDVRTFGFFHEYKEAVQRLHENTCDMHENMYKYAVVEEVSPGIHPYSDNRQFFKYDESRDGFFEIEEPEEVKHLCNFSVG